MRRILLINAVLLVAVLHCFASDNYSVQWQKGNECYQQKQYDSAAYYFEQIAARKPDNAEVYYNLGNTYYRLNKIGPAVLNYERALRINPEYQDAKDNLLLAQNRISNHILSTGDIFFVKWWQSLTRADRSAVWAVAALLTFLAIIVLFLVRHFRKSNIPLQLPGVLIFICICFLFLAFASAQNRVQHNSAVVMQNDAPLMNAEQKGKPIALIPEGTSVKIVSEKGIWVEVSLPDGRSGWLQQNLIDKI